MPYTEDVGRSSPSAPTDVVENTTFSLVTVGFELGPLCLAVFARGARRCAFVIVRVAGRFSQGFGAAIKTRVGSGARRRRRPSCSVTPLGTSVMADGRYAGVTSNEPQIH